MRKSHRGEYGHQLIAALDYAMPWDVGWPEDGLYVAPADASNPSSFVG